MVSGELGVEPGTVLLARLSRHLGVSTILPVILTQPHTDTETLQLINMELEELGRHVSLQQK